MPEAVLLTLTAFGSGWALCWLRETYRQDAERLLRRRAREETERRRRPEGGAREGVPET